MIRKKLCFLYITSCISFECQYWYETVFDPVSDIIFMYCIYHETITEQSLQTLSQISQRYSFLDFVCVVTWRTRPSGSPKLFSQMAHLYGFSLRCVCACFSNAAGSENSVLHSLHFVSGWATRLCAFSSLGIVKISLHSSHGIPARGWASFLCVFRSLGNEKTSEHSLHGKPFSRWLFSWDLSRSGRLKVFWQTSQWYGFTPECVFLCLFMFPNWANFLSHWSHSYGRSPVWIRWCT